MADTHETDRAGVSAADAVRALFAQLPAPGKDLIWLADELIGIAQHAGSVMLARVADSDAHALVCRTDADPPFSPGRDAVRLFRPLLARLAVLGADETGTEPQLYGGRYALTRSSRGGPVRLEIEFTNTPGLQQLTITRVPVSAPRLSSAPEVAEGADGAAPQPLA
jgi:hypothetical protein